MIIPAILEQSIDEVQKKIDRVREYASCVQIDIIDDHKTVDIKEVLTIQFGSLSVDIHLMTDRPEQFLEPCVMIEKKAVSLRAIGQIERMEDQRHFLLMARSLHFRAGLALDLYTPISSLDPIAKEEADCILLMSVKAGFSGKHFDHRVVEKIGELKDSPYNGAIVVDGGEDPEHIRLSRNAGATEFAVGQFLWQHEDVNKALLELEVNEKI